MSASLTNTTVGPRLALALAALTAPFLIAAQVSLYSFSQSVEPYTEITETEAAYSLGVPTWWPPLYNQRAWTNHSFYGVDGQVCSYLNPATGPGYPIGFDFRYNGDVFDRISVSHSGFITFGKSSDGDQAVWTYAIDHPHGMPFVQYVGGPTEAYKRNRVAGWGSSQLYMQDMTPQVPPGPISNLRIATIGTAPERVLVVQYKDFLMAYPPSSSRVNFQIRLNESDNSVEVRYGQVIVAGGSYAQVGLGGRTPEDYNGRRTVYEEPDFLYDMNATVAITENTETCYFVAAQPGQPAGSGVPPAVGLNLKWTPDACAPPVWPLTIDEVSFDSGHASWDPTAATEYEYYLTDTNFLGGPEIASGITSDPEVYLFGLEASTTYYLFVRGICDGEPGVWSMATPMETLGGGLVNCDGTILTEDYCSKQYDVKEWLYVSGDGSPLKIEFLGGYVGNVSGVESFRVWDGTSDAGTPAPAMSGNLAGREFLANTNNALFIRLITDAGACEAQPWYLPLQWRVGCKNCTDPLVNYAVGEVDCDAQEYYVDVNIFSMGSATNLVVRNSLDETIINLASTGVHAVGPFPAGEAVVVTVQNPDNEMCYSEGPILVNEPCAIVDCGPTWYERCAGQSETRDWLLQGDGQAISVRFPPIYIGWDADVYVFDGTDETATPSYTFSGSGSNQVYTSTNAGHNLLVRYISSQYLDYACTAGNTLPFEFVAECASACTAPVATFSTVCVDQTHFNVEVNVTEVGSAGTATITNDMGVASVSVTAVGTYSVGPFTSGTPVTFTVAGANVLCSITSNALDRSCLGIGIEEAAMHSLALYPNPNDGHFTLELPSGMYGDSHLQVLDLAGRVVQQRHVSTAAVQQFDLSALPNGSYAVVLHNNGRAFHGRVSVQH